MSTEPMHEATQAFYKWEEETGRTWLSDYDRIVWCEGYLQAKREAYLFVPTGSQTEFVPPRSLNKAKQWEKSK